MRLSKARQDNPGLNTFPLLYNTFNTSPFQNGVINWTRTISPHIVNEARVGVNNVMLDNGGADKGLGNIAQSAGIQNAGRACSPCRDSIGRPVSATRISAMQQLIRKHDLPLCR